MSTTDGALVIPARFSAASYALVVDVGGAPETVTLSVAAGRDYWRTSDGLGLPDSAAGNADLLTLLAEAIESHSAAPRVTPSITYVSGEPRLQLTCSTALSLLWADGSTTLDPAVFGFDGNTSAGTSIVAPNRLPGLWLPRSPIAFDSRDRRDVLRGLDRTMTGRIIVTDWGEMAARREVSFEFLRQNVILEEFSSSPEDAFEVQWVASISKGRRFRLYDDVAGVPNGASFATYTIDRSEEPHERNEEYTYRWDVRLAMRAAGLNSEGGGDSVVQGGFGAGSFGSGFGF